MNLENTSASIEQELNNLKKAYAIIEEREASLLTFYNSVSQMLGVVDVTATDVRNVLVNETAVQFRGEPREKFQGAWASELGVPQERINQWIQRYHQAEQEKRPVEFEYSIEIKGDVRWLLATVRFIERLSDEMIRCSF
ncbi:MAG: hypothetical protein DWQ04_23215, partial [Chloroflexi bacterium]